MRKILKRALLYGIHTHCLVKYLSNLMLVGLCIILKLLFRYICRAKFSGKNLSYLVLLTIQLRSKKSNVDIKNGRN